jgi:hypothetical protein
MTQHFTPFSFAAEAANHAHFIGIGSRLASGFVRALFGFGQLSFCIS